MLHKSQTTMCLHKEIPDFKENSNTILTNSEKTCIVGCSDLLNKIHKHTVFWLLNKNVPGIYIMRKCNNNVEINGHGLLELEGDNNFSSCNRNAFIVNPQ